MNTRRKFIVFGVLVLALNSLSPTLGQRSDKGVKPKPKEKAGAASAVQHVTVGNFVSLDILTMSGKGRQEHLLVKDKSVSVLSVQRFAATSVPSRTVPLSPDDMASIIKTLDTARFPSLEGRYSQTRLFDVGSTMVTLSLKTENKTKA